MAKNIVAPQQSAVKIDVCNFGLINLIVTPVYKNNRVIDIFESTAKAEIKPKNQHKVYIDISKESKFGNLLSLDYSDTDEVIAITDYTSIPETYRGQYGQDIYHKVTKTSEIFSKPLVFWMNNLYFKEERKFEVYNGYLSDIIGRNSGVTIFLGFYLAFPGLEVVCDHKENNKYQKQNDSGYVYFILDCTKNCVKIGKSKNPKNRLKHLSIGNPSLLKIIKTIKTSSMSQDEKYYHTKFAEYRIAETEWFFFDSKEEALNEIARLTSN